jgi:hypothetical protein
MPSTQETQLRIRQTLDVDPEINFINWELNIQDVAAATARSVHARGLLSLVLNPTQWDTNVSNVSTNNQGQSVIAQRYSPPEYTEITADMSPTEITVSKMRNKTRDDWRIAEQNLKLAIMDSVGEKIRHIIAPPTIAISKHDYLEYNRGGANHLWENNTSHRQKNQGNPS